MNNSKKESVKKIYCETCGHAIKSISKEGFTTDTVNTYWFYCPVCKRTRAYQAETIKVT